MCHNEDDLDGPTGTVMDGLIEMHGVEMPVTYGELQPGDFVPPVGPELEWHPGDPLILPPVPDCYYPPGATPLEPLEH
jgi:hypothetical protein